MKKLVVVSGLVAAMTLPMVAFAQEAPTPHASPRTPVQREQRVAEHRAPPSRDVEGQALIIDGEKLRINDADLRLFGIVPPQLSASFGPQARAALDSLAAGQTTSCHIRDRDHDGRLLATCKTASGSDLALELLKRGLAVSARGSLADTELVQPYIAAEAAAQNQKLGLWSVMVPGAASVSAVTAPDISAQQAQEDTKKAEAAKQQAAADAAKQEAAKAEQAKADAAKAEQLKADIAKAEQARIEATRAAEKAVEAAKAIPVSIGTTMTGGDSSPNFFARYQLLLAGILMLFTASSIVGSLIWQRRRERIDDIRALAAALRGELMAARAVCLTRIKTILTDEDDRAAVWPRLRATLYQAYVGRIGSLGAELARQIASIYGQASDYAAYYNSSDDGTTPKRQALAILIKHIEDVLPRLAQIEATGRRPASSPLPLPPSPPTRKLTVTSEPAPETRTLSITSIPHDLDETRVSDEPGVKVEEAKMETAEDKPPVEAEAKPEAEEKPATVVSAAAPVHVTVADTQKAAEEVTASAAVMGEGLAPEIVTVTEEAMPKAEAAAPLNKSDAALQELADAVAGNTQAPGALWDSLRRFAREHLTPRNSANDDPMADYATLIEQDIANMTFDEADENMTTADYLRKSGVR